MSDKEPKLQATLRDLAKTKVFHADTFKRAREAMNRAAACLDAAELKHEGECQIDAYAKGVCEGMYVDKCDEVHQLRSALRAIYSLTGESKTIETLCREVFNDTGGEW